MLRRQCGSTMAALHPGHATTPASSSPERGRWVVAPYAEGSCRQSDPRRLDVSMDGSLSRLSGTESPCQYPNRAKPHCLHSPSAASEHAAQRSTQRGERVGCLVPVRRPERRGIHRVSDGTGGRAAGGGAVARRSCREILLPSLMLAK